eukprot:c16925_g1_i1 orf=2-427(+)
MKEELEDELRNKLELETEHAQILLLGIQRLEHSLQELHVGEMKARGELEENVFQPQRENKALDGKQLDGVALIMQLENELQGTERKIQNLHDMVESQREQLQKLDVEVSHHKEEKLILSRDVAAGTSQLKKAEEEIFNLQE